MNFQSYQNERATMSSVTDEASGAKFSYVIKIEGEKIRSHVDGVARKSAELTRYRAEGIQSHGPCGTARRSNAMKMLHRLLVAVDLRPRIDEVLTSAGSYRRSVVFVAPCHGTGAL